jgi:uncharacterized repeat protein (TIGR04052 family)
MKKLDARAWPIVLGALVFPACGSEADDQPEPFALRFAPLVDGGEVGCMDELQGLGPTASDRLGLNDLRFYVSNLRFRDTAGNDVDLTLDTNEFQYASPEGSVTLIDLTGNTEGSCGSTSVAFAEGTARTNPVLTGMTLLPRVASIAFEVGVPQAVMRATIATNTPEGAPSPLNEMYWNWNSGYRHFVFNFSVRDSADSAGAGYLHVGSRDCAVDGDTKALSDRDRCTFVNTPSVSLSPFDLTTNSVGIDLRGLVEGIDFKAPLYAPESFEVIGEGPGAECHSAPMQPDCVPVFGKLGLDLSTGTADAALNTVFVRRSIP